MPEVLTKDVMEQIGKHHNELLATVKDEIANLNGKFEATVQSKVEKLNARLDELEIKHLRPQTQAVTADAEAEALKKNQKDAYMTYLRKGEGHLGPEKVKLLTEADATTGGFFVIPEYESEITKAVILISPIRQYARGRTTSSDTVKVPKRTGTFAATWVAEAATQNEATGLKYGMDNVANFELTAFQDVSNVDLEDNQYDLAAELNAEFAEQFAKAEGAAFVNGSGVGQPEGFMNNSAIAVDVTGSASALTYDGFVNCCFNLKSAYAANATWFLNRQTIGQVRLLKDGQGRPIWLPWAEAGLQGKNGPTILGLPYAEVPDMPNVGAGTYPVALGDWRRAYMIVDRIGISVMRDPYTIATKSAVRFLARKRVGGQLVLAESVRKMQCHT